MNAPVNLTTIADLRAFVGAARRAGESVGLVPTMGYLHAGHAALVRAAADGNDRVVVSVFVNPIQFGPGEDLAAYPRDLEHDRQVIAESGGHAVFAPSVEEMYPLGAPLTRVRVDEVSAALCGRSRPVHFEGVATVVAKLFAATEADRAYFGRKDAQQLAVVTRMAAELSFRTEVVPCPTLREADGLAMSSRNTYLSDEERAAAPVLYRALTAAASLVTAGERDPRIVESELQRFLSGEVRLDVEYAEVRDAGTIASIERIGDGDVLVAVAGRLGPARLIDNFVLHVDGDTVGVEAGEIITPRGPM